MEVEDLTIIHVQTSIPKAMFHIFKANVGAGIFFIPTFFNMVGYLQGPVMLAIVGFLVIDCISFLILVKQRLREFEVPKPTPVAPQRKPSEHRKKRQGESGDERETPSPMPPSTTVAVEPVASVEPPSTYEDVAALLFTPQLRTWVKISLTITQYGFCIMYLQYSASLLIRIFHRGSYALFIILGALVATPFTFLTHKLHLMAYGSIIATGYLALTILVTSVDVGQALASGSSAALYQTDSEVKPYGTIAGTATFFASCFTVLQCIGVILPVENSVVEKDKYLFATRVTMALIVLLYSVFGLSGYLAYGNELTASIVHHLPAANFSTDCAQLGLAIALWLTYPVQYLPAIQICEKMLLQHVDGAATDGTSAAAEGGDQLQRRKQARFYWLAGLRLVLNAVIAAVAFGIGSNTVALTVSFLGAFASTSLCITFPALMYLRLAENSDQSDVFYGGDEATAAGTSNTVGIEQTKEGYRSLALRLKEKGSGLPLRSYMMSSQALFDLRGSRFSHRRLRAVVYVAIGIVVTIISIYDVVLQWVRMKR